MYIHPEFKSLFFHSWIHFFWHSHFHTLATISPTACLPAYLSSAFHFFPFSLYFTLFSLVSFPSFFPFLPKVFGSCCPPDTMSFSSQFPSVNLYFERHYHIVRTMVFPALIYGCESWTIKKPERQRIDAFEVWCWRRLLRVPWTQRRANQSILKEINPEYSLEGLMLKLKFQYFGHLM